MSIRWRMWCVFDYVGLHLPKPLGQITYWHTIVCLFIVHTCDSVCCDDNAMIKKRKMYVQHKIQSVT